MGVGAGQVGTFSLRAALLCMWGVRSAAAGFSFWGGPRRDRAVCQGLAGCAESAGGLRELGVRVSCAGGGGQEGEPGFLAGCETQEP